MTVRMWKIAMNALKILLSKASKLVAARNNITPLQSRCCGIILATVGWDSTGIISLPDFW